MEQEKQTEVLQRLKMLLGITDGSKDELLSFLIDDTINLILGYCRICFLPRPLESLVPVIAADMYRAKGYGNESAPEIVKSISEGQRSVSLDSKTPDSDFLTNYYDRLKPFVNRRGKVPSDVGKICGCV